ncbi:MAG: WD40 repeat domain-containing protein [Methanomicrobiales archaeon]|nr:WD40 repeat domain-containing protein [Methanomicrobiales archaeon]
MSSGEMSSIHFCARRGTDSQMGRAAQSGHGDRGRSLSLLLFFFLIPALCGSASAIEGMYVPLWNMGANDAVASVAISQDGTAIVAGAGSTVHLMDRDGDILWRTTVGSRVNGVGISPEGSHIGVAADKLYLFDSTGDLLWTEKTTFVYRSVDISSDLSSDLPSRAMYIATGCDNGAIYIFNPDKEELWDYDMGTRSYDIAISRNGLIIVAGCDDQGVYYLNSREGESWSYGTGKRVKGIALTPDGRFVAAGSDDRCIYLSTGAGEHLWKYPTGDPVPSTALTEEAREVFAASGRSVLVLDSSGAEIQTIPFNDRVESIAVTPDGSFLVIGGGDQSIHLFTRDKSLLASESRSAPADETAPRESVTTPAAGSASAVAEVTPPPPAEETSIFSKVLGWLENIFSLLFRPQEDFIA